MAFDVISILWHEDYVKMESYSESRTVEATYETEEDAHNYAEELVDMWCSYEKRPVRFVNGKDHGAYVESDWRRTARGIRVTVAKS